MAKILKALEDLHSWSGVKCVVKINL